ncbi:MAG: DNA ligase [Arcobacteraceae bacterium]|nr:DNA ligase [Arcobacteraceae bacterium]
MFKFLLSFLLFYSFAFSFEVQKPQIYDDQNISGWLMSEKLDGIRGYWDGKAIYSKNGNLINTPLWFTKNFPPFPLDGELWSKRNDFEFIQSTVLDTNSSNDWEKITYNIFEVPDAKGDFPTRLQKAKEWFAQHPNPHINIIKQIVCKDEQQLQNYLNEIIALKGEGVVIKDGNQPYHTGRSPHILKVKKVQDMEGIVIGYNYDKEGKFKSLKLKLDSGVIFNLGGGFSDKERETPPKLGMMVTFKYYGFTKNDVPKFASFLRVREKE